MVSNAPRQLQFLLAEPERRLLRWIAARPLGRVMPDHLTILGVVAAVGILVAYALSAADGVWLWVASGLLVVHWLGDSLDGTLARVRGIQRPRYGYYLDHLVDAVATTLIGIGLGLSAQMLLITGAIVVVAYLMLSINTYLETQALGSFNLGYGLVGPTEIRLLLVALNTALALGVTPHAVVGGTTLGLLDFAGAGLVAVMAVALAVRVAGNLKTLALAEPAHNSVTKSGPAVG